MSFKIVLDEHVRDQEHPGINHLMLDPVIRWATNCICDIRVHARGTLTSKGNGSGPIYGEAYDVNCLPCEKSVVVGVMIF